MDTNDPEIDERMKAASHVNNWELVTRLLQQGGNVDEEEKQASFLAYLTESENDSPLHKVIALNNVKLLQKYIVQLQDDQTLEKAHDILSRVYEELKIQNVPLSDEIDLCFQEMLLDFRFYQEKGKIKDTKDNSNPMDALYQRINDTINLITTFEQVEGDKFVLVSRFIVQNLRVLKRQLRTSYKVLPWEEIEFCLIIFILSLTKPNDSDVIYKIVLDKQQMAKYLTEFSRVLAEVQKNLTPADLNPKVPLTGRENYVRDITSKNPTFKQLYSDFELIKDVYSLTRIQQYLQIALSDDTNTNVFIGKLVVQRSLQVIGECMKNSPTSPNISQAVHKFLISLAPRKLKIILNNLRDSLSHAQSLTRKLHLENYESPEYFNNILDDMKKVQADIVYILYKIKMEGVKVFFRKILDCTDLKEIKQLCSRLYELRLNENYFSNYQSNCLQRTLVLVDQLHMLIGSSDVARESKFQQISELISSQQTRLDELTVKYEREIQQALTIIRGVKHTKQIDNIKSLVNNCLVIMTPDSQPQTLKKIWNFVKEICSGKEIPVYLYCQLFCIIEFEIGRVEIIDDFREKLDEDDHVVDESADELFSTVAGKFNLGKDRTEFLKEIANKKQTHQVKRDLIEIMRKKDVRKDSFHDLVKHLRPKERDKLTQLYQDEQYDVCLTLIQKIDDVYGNFLKRLSDVHVFSLNKYKKVVKSFLTSIKLKKDANARLLEATNSFLTDIDNHVAKYFEGRLELIKRITEGSKRTELLRNNMKKAAAEMLLLELTEILEHLDLFQEPRCFYDQFSPLLVGKSLRNYLAHGDALADISLVDPNICTIANIYKFMKEGTNLIFVENTFIGTKQCLGGRRFEESLAFVTEIGEWFQSIETDDLTKIRTHESKMKIRNHLFQTGLHMAARFNSLNAFQCLLKYNSLEAVDANGKSSVICAAENGSCEVITLLLEKGLITADSRYTNGKTLLHVASKCNKPNLVELLLNNEIDVDTGNDDLVTPLHLAALEDHPNMVQLLLSKGAHVNIQDISGLTALHAASFSGNQLVIDILLKHGADIDAKNANRWTPLYVALTSREYPTVHQLLRNGADVNLQDADDMLPLHIAATSNNKDVVCEILRRTKDIDAVDNEGDTALHVAANFGHKDVIEALLREGADANSANITRTTPLHWAARQKGCDCAKLLLDYGANVNARSKEKITPLHVAAAEGRESTVELLINCKADVHARDGFESTPLYKAAEKGCQIVVEMLLRSGADVNTRNVNHWTPLHVATSFGHVDVTKVLLQHQELDLAAKSTTGWTALHVVSITGHSEIASELIERVDTFDDFVDDDNATPLHFAATEGHVHIVKLLLSAGANLEARNNELRTPLHLTAFKGQEETLKILLKAGADINAKDIEDNTPLHFASKYGHKEVVAILLDHGADTQVKTTDETTPQQLAAMFGRTNILRMLPCEATALHFAVAQNDQDCILFLLRDMQISANARNELLRTPLHMAALFGSVDAIATLLTHGSDIDAVDADENTPLHIAVLRKNEAAARVLLQNGAHPELCNNQLLAPLHLAVHSDAKETAKDLLNAGADVNKTTIASSAPLHVAVFMGNETMTEILLNYNPDCDAKNELLSTPLHLAAEKDHVKITKMLLDKGAFIDSQDNKLETPLHVAVTNNFPNVTKILIQRGAAVNAQNRNLQTPLHIAAFHNYGLIAQLLVENNADVSLLDDHSNTPLHAALVGGHNDVALMFLESEHGASICNSAGPRNATPLQLAARFCNANIVNLLIKLGADVLGRNDHHTVLHNAVAGGNEPVLRTVLKAIEEKCDPNGRKVQLDAPDNEGDTPLMWAIENKLVSVVNILLDHGCNPWVKNYSGKNALDWAIDVCDEDVLNLLIINWEEREEGSKNT